jgi:hypothetical protein
LLHAPSRVDASFDEPNLVSVAGLVPVLRLAAAAGLWRLVRDRLRVGGPCGANPAGKVAAIVAGMVAGADSIDDLDVVRHGGMRRLFGEVYAPSTLGSFLRALSWGHVRQLESAARAFLAGLAAATPLLPGADPGPHRPPRPKDHPAPTRALAMGRRLDRAVHRHPRPTRRSLTCPTLTRARPDNQQWNKPEP